MVLAQIAVTILVESCIFQVLHNIYLGLLGVMQWQVLHFEVMRQWHHRHLK